MVNNDVLFSDERNRFRVLDRDAVFVDSAVQRVSKERYPTLWNAYGGPSARVVAGEDERKMWHDWLASDGYSVWGL